MKLAVICMSLLLVLVTAQPQRCFRAAAYGDCQGHRSMWAYSPFQNKCIRFDYSGCGGNDNRFGCHFECEWTCHAARVTTSSPNYALFDS